jgi:glycosyltransferase involved in cell wall biosynthesis
MDRLPLRISYLLSWSRPGRLASHAQSIQTAAALARFGHRVTLLMPQRAGDPALSAGDLRDAFRVEGDFALVQRPSRWVSENFAASGLWLRRAFRDPELRASDVLLSRMPTMLALGAGSPVPFAFDHYRRWPDDLPFIRPLVRRTAATDKCLGFILHSALAAASYRRAGVPEGKLLVAYNGADAVPATGPVDLPGDRSIALYAGRLSRKKGLDQLLALARLRQEVLFVLVGSEGEGPIEREARALANVTIVPWQDSVAAWLAAADVLLIPSSRAPLERHRNCVLPIKLFAYLAAGRPILAPAAPDTAELLTHEGNAILVPPDDPEAAAAGLDRILADPALAARLGAEARRLAGGLGWDERAARISHFLAERIAERTSPQKPLV